MIDSDLKVTALLAMANKQYKETRSISKMDTLLPYVILFVVLEMEHLLVESLLEQQLQEAHDIHVHCLTLPGCSKRLYLDTKQRLILDGKWEVSVVYFRGGITDYCYSEAGWAAREVIERAMAIKTPSVACLLAGSKVVQAALCKRDIIDKFLPGLSKDVKDQLFESLTEGRVVGENPRSLKIDHPEGVILKKEQGVWIGDEMLKVA